MESKKVDKIKLVVLGTSGVGKTSITTRFCKDTFNISEKSTIGASFFIKEVRTSEGKTLKYEIWDTAGQESYRSLASLYYKDASAALLVYDVTNRESFQELENWMRELKDKGEPGVKIAIAANKGDLEQIVTSEEGEKFATKHNAFFKCVSAKEDWGIKELFQGLSELSFPSPVRTFSVFHYDF